MCSAKVVGIHGGKSMPGSVNTQPLPVSLAKLRDDMKLKLKCMLQELFDNADDALFSMADKAGANGDQAVYFDAMRELRLQKKTIAIGLIRAVIKSFNELGQFSAHVNAIDSGLSDWDDLGLVKNDDLELSVAVEGMVTRLRSTAASNIDDLKVRIESLMPGLELSSVQIPLSPEMLCESFLEGCAVLDVDIQVRLVVLKLFEKYVLKEMAALYVEANQSLVKQGILPNLKTKKINAKRASDVSKNAEPSSNMPSSNMSKSNAPPYEGVQQVECSKQNLSEEPPVITAFSGSIGGDEAIPVLNADQCLSGGQFESIRELMHPEEKGQKTIVSDQASAQSVSYYSQRELISALSGFQQKQLNQPSAFASNSVIDYQMLLKTTLPTQEGKAAYSELDSDVINLVSMLFDFILEDRQLQSEMKVLISRLQIPILKVAIMDRSFFDRGGHSARKLLNQIASSAIGWNKKPEGQPDRLKDKIEDTVQKVLTDFENDQGLFTGLLADFTKFIDLELRRGQLVEQRTKDSERGKAANDVAKEEVKNTLMLSMKGHSIPVCVIELLDEAWSRLMVLTYLKEGKKSNAWRAACDLVNDLIWTVCPEGEEEELNTKLVRLIPGVMRRFRTGLKEISFDEFRMSDLLKALEAEHITVLQTLQQRELARLDKVEDVAEGNLPEMVNGLVEDEVDEIVDEVVKNSGLDVVEQEPDVVSDLARETLEMEAEFKDFQKNSLSQKHEEQAGVEGVYLAEADVTENNLLEESVEPVQAPEIENEEIILASLEKDALVCEVDESDPFVQQVSRFAPGCWFEFKDDSQLERCKLAAIIKATGKYIFVNRSGVKVAEKTKMGLAVELKRGSVQVLNDGLLFDRALESVIGSLRGRGKN